MGDYALDVEVREDKGKGVARKLRRAGRIPAICYGRKMESVPITIDPRALERLIQKSEAGMNTLIDLKGGGSLDGMVVLVREIQRDPAKSHPLHADLVAIDLQEKIEVSVPIHLTGKAAGVEMGGILDQALREVSLRCFPRAIPSEVALDVSSLEVGSTVHVRDLGLPEDVELVSDPELSVVSVVIPAAAEEEAPVEAVEGAVPAEGEAPPAESEAAEKAEPGAEEAKGD